MFGELVCGPPGSGKTTYCEGKRQFLSVYDPARPVIVLNLDPANEEVFPYPCDIDIRDIACHEKVMEGEVLGPNGTYLMCAAILEDNLDWILNEIEVAVRRREGEVAAATAATYQAKGSSTWRPPYLLVDCPGQVEFYINSSFMHRLLSALQKKLHCNLCTVHLVDAAVATRDLATYVSTCLLAVTTMVDHELPHINVLTKWDTVILEELETEAGDCPYLNTSELLEDHFDRIWRKNLRARQRDHRNAQYFVTGHQKTAELDAEDRKSDQAIETLDLEKSGGRVYRYSKALLDVVAGYGIVGFVPLNVQSQEHMLTLTQQIDNAIGLFV